jgi:hypothetical protein
MVKKIIELPTDVMADIARVILQAGLEHRLVDAGRETVKMELPVPEHKSKAIQNIEEIISDYNFFRYSNNE